MINLNAIVPNEPKVSILDYITMIYGVGKAGKTSLLYKLAQTDYIGGLDKLLLIAFEKGYKALHGIHAYDVIIWDDFVKIVDALVSQKNDTTYKIIGLDTLDYLYKSATEFVIKRERQARKDPKIKAVNDIPWGQGYVLIEEEVDKQIKRLVNSGYGIFMITHDKEKKIELKNGQSYDKTTFTLPERARNLFVNMSDFICYISINKELVNGNLNETRYIHFRSDGDMEAGSRFDDLPDKIEYDVDLFLETFEKAVLSSYKNDKKAVSKAKEVQAEQREQEVKDYVQSETEPQGKTAEQYIEELSSKIKTMDKPQQEQLKVELKAQLGTVNYKTYTEITQFEQATVIVDTILG